MTQKELDILTNIIGGVETGGQIYCNRRYGAYTPPYNSTRSEVIPYEYKNWKVYIHINKINQKKYVGITGQTLQARWRTNGIGYKGQIFYKAIKKYGWNNFDHIVLKDTYTQKEACNIEKMLISFFNSSSKKYGYNMSDGGEGNTGSYSISKNDMIGRKFKRLTVIDADIKKSLLHSERYWLCKCNCGNIISCRQSHLLKGGTTSCGCLTREKALARRNINKVVFYSNYVQMFFSNSDTTILLDDFIYDKIKHIHWSFSPSKNTYSIGGTYDKKHYKLLDFVFDGNIKQSSRLLFIFKNNDNYDLRRNNIDIVNPTQKSYEEYIISLYKQSQYIAYDYRVNKWMLYIKNITKCLYYDSIYDAIAERNKYLYIEPTTVGSFLLQKHKKEDASYDRQAA